MVSKGAVGITTWPKSLLSQPFSSESSDQSAEAFLPALFSARLSVPLSPDAAIELLSVSFCSLLPRSIEFSLPPVPPPQPLRPSLALSLSSSSRSSSLSAALARVGERRDFSK